MGERTKFYTRMNSVSLLVVLSALAASAAGDEVARKPKLFFVSTSSTTTTLQTASLCYATSGTSIGTCTGRKRRSINIEGVPLLFPPPPPSQPPSVYLVKLFALHLVLRGACSQRQARTRARGCGSPS